MPHASPLRLRTHLEPLNAAMAEFKIDTPRRQAAFLAQLAHESGEFRYFEEIWGPTEAQLRYEGRADLGNCEPGDGKRFKGRGPIQITGRANYRKAGVALGVDLLKDPEIAATVEVGFRIAGWYWATHGCNLLADQERFDVITRAINGGVNGKSSRDAYYAACRKVLGVCGPTGPEKLA